MRTPPRKQRGTATGARRINGIALDVATMASEQGITEKTVRSQVARGLIPYRRLGGRIVFLRSEVEEFLHRLPGVSIEEALANIEARKPRPDHPEPAEPAR